MKLADPPLTDVKSLEGVVGLRQRLERLRWAQGDERRRERRRRGAAAGGERIANQRVGASVGGSTLAALVFAFIGGILLNLMPCVFPVLGIKVVGFVEHAHGDARAMKMQGLVFTRGRDRCRSWCWRASCWHFAPAARSWAGASSSSRRYS